MATIANPFALQTTLTGQQQYNQQLPAQQPQTPPPTTPVPAPVTTAPPPPMTAPPPSMSTPPPTTMLNTPPVPPPPAPAPVPTTVRAGSTPSTVTVDPGAINQTIQTKSGTQNQAGTSTWAATAQQHWDTGAAAANKGFQAAVAAGAIPNTVQGYAQWLAEVSKGRAAQDPTVAYYQQQAYGGAAAGLDAANVKVYAADPQRFAAEMIRAQADTLNPRMIDRYLTAFVEQGEDIQPFLQALAAAGSSFQPGGTVPQSTAPPGAQDAITRTGYTAPNRSVLPGAFSPTAPPPVPTQTPPPGGGLPPTTSDPGAGPRGSSGVPQSIIDAILPGGTPPGGTPPGGGTPSTLPPFQQFGPGNDLRSTQINPTPSDRYNTIAEAVNQARSGLQGPDRSALAADALDLFERRSEEAYTDRVRQTTKQAAKFGLQGAGMVNRSLADSLTTRERELADARTQAANYAAGQTLGDRLGIFGALTGEEGSQFYRDASGRGELRGEREWQNLMQQQGIQDLIRMLTLEASLTGRDASQVENRLRTLLGYGYGSTPNAPGGSVDQSSVEDFFRYLTLYGSGNN